MVNQPRHDRLSTTVGIIGAGAAGLTAAIWATVEGRGPSCSKAR